jgi:hypothetical protein
VLTRGRRAGPGLYRADSWSTEANSSRLTTNDHGTVIISSKVGG